MGEIYYMVRTHFILSLIALMTSFSACPAHAQSFYDANEDIVHLITPETQSKLWINAGMTSYHFQQDQNLNGGNWGAGLEYRFNTVASVTAGRFLIAIEIIRITLASTISR